MSNVKVHPYEGSEPFCADCELPKKNKVHRAQLGMSYICCTFPDDTFMEWFNTDLTKAELIVRITQAVHSQPELEAP